MSFLADVFLTLAAFLPTWIVVLIFAVAAVFLILLIVKLIGFILDAIPFV